VSRATRSGGAELVVTSRSVGSSRPGLVGPAAAPPPRPPLLRHAATTARPERSKLGTHRGMPGGAMTIRGSRGELACI
jgi:hypothetical protein